MKDRMKVVRELQSGMHSNSNGLARQKVGIGKRVTNAERTKLNKQRE